MCNLAGWVGKIEKEEVIGLFSSIQGGNTDASGIGVEIDKTLKIFKSPQPATQMIETDRWNDWANQFIGEAKVGMIHCRKATHGDASNNANNHPHFSREYGTMLIHRGVVTPTVSYPAQGECDSEQILHSLNILGLEKGIGNLAGWATIAFLQDPMLWLFTSGMSLKLLKTPERIIFSGSREFGKITIGKNHWVGININTLKIVHGPRVKLSSFVHVSPNYSSQREEYEDNNKYFKEYYEGFHHRPYTLPL